jgi:hypothetical protein
MGDAFGFEALFMHCWRVREQVLDVIEDTTGGRVIFGSCKVGGVRRDVTPEQLDWMLKKLAEVEKEMRLLVDVFLNDDSVKHRLCGVCVLSRADAQLLGAAGPTLRGSGVADDMRLLKYAAFGDLDFQPVAKPDGDSYSRCAVRCEELFQSVDLIRQAVAKIPAGEIAVKVVGTPNGEVFARTEQPRGELVNYIKADGSKNLVRFRARMPTFANLPALVKMLAGCELADVPVLVLTIDPASAAWKGNRHGVLPNEKNHPGVGRAQAGHDPVSVRAPQGRARLARPAGHPDLGLHLLRPLRQALPDRSPEGGPAEQTLAHRPPALHLLRQLRRFLPEEVPEADAGSRHPRRDPRLGDILTCMKIA